MGDDAGQSERRDSPSERYKHLAKELRDMAANTNSASARAEFLTLAQQYDRMAEIRESFGPPIKPAAD
jgi:hypothetical protein